MVSEIEVSHLGVRELDEWQVFTNFNELELRSEAVPRRRKLFSSTGYYLVQSLDRHHPVVR